MSPLRYDSGLYVPVYRGDTTRITCQADDTYLGGHHTYIYEAFEETRVEQRATCTLESNVKKLKAFSVNHGVANVPQYILDAQGGHITGFKCVSAFVGPDTNEGTAWKIAMLTKTLEKKLDFLDPLDAMPKHLMDNKDAFGLRHYQYNYLSRCANTMPTYFQRLMPPSVTCPAIAAAVTQRLRRSMELLTEAISTPEDERNEWWERCQLDVSMGGQGIGGLEAKSAPAFCAQIAQSWPRLRATSPALAHLDGVTHSIPMLDEFTGHYNDLVAECSEIASKHKELHDSFFYTTCRGGKEHYFNPKSLPPAARLPRAERLLQVHDKTSKFLPPAQRKLTSIVKHRKFLEARTTAQQRDHLHPHPSTRFRTEAMLVSNAQHAAGSPLELPPDGTIGTTMDDFSFLHYLQRQGGLDLSRAKPRLDALEAEGHTVDRKGDNLQNNIDTGQFTKRHNKGLHAVADMVRAVAVGSVVLGDKEKPELTEELNDTHTIDVAELGGDMKNNRNVLYELKTPTVTKHHWIAGYGSAELGGAPASTGHLVGFGNTDEYYRVKVLGTKQRGQPTDSPLDHATGKGYVREFKGQYYDAFLVKKALVVVFLIEAGSGGICPQGAKSINYLHERAKGARDGTRYGTSNIATRSFRRHHTQRISFAVVAQDAANIAHNVKHGKISKVSVSAATYM